jgi:hypothetical protein
MKVNKVLGLAALGASITALLVLSVFVAQLQAAPRTVLAGTPAVFLPYVARGYPQVPESPTPIPGLSPDSVLYIANIQYETEDEYIHIGNIGQAAQDMTGWQILSVEGGELYTFPAGFVLAPGAAVKVHSGPAATGDPPADLIWGAAAVWQDSGDKAVLSDDTGQLVDSLCYKDGCP